MIFTVTPNPALDITYRVPRVTPGIPHRVEEVIERPGGKGLNVASVLATLGEDVVVAGFLGGRDGQRIRELAATVPGIRDARPMWVDVEANSRRCLTVVDAEQTATVFNEPGVQSGLGAWQNLIGQLAIELQPGDVLVSSGSVPPLTQAGSVGRLVRLAHSARGRALVDTSGRWLPEAARAGADLLKPNHVELAEATNTDDVIAGARKLIALGARGVLVTSGADGMSLFLAGVPDAHWSARGPRQSGNATGAGDAAVAAWARALASGRPLAEVAAETLRDAVALSGAAVAAPAAGEFDAGLYAELPAQVELTEQPG